MLLRAVTGRAVPSPYPKYTEYMGLYESPVPICWTRTVEILLFPAYRVPSCGHCRFRSRYLCFLLSFFQLKPHVLHFVARQDVILWRGIIMQPHMKHSLSSGVKPPSQTLDLRFTVWGIKGVGPSPQGEARDPKQNNFHVKEKHAALRGLVVVVVVVVVIA